MQPLASWPAAARAGLVGVLTDIDDTLTTEGRITGAHCDFLQDAGAYPTPWPVGTAALTAMLFPGPYRVPQAGFRTRCVYTSTAGRTAYRGPWMFETFAREVLLDISARRMGIDPAELTNPWHAAGASMLSFVVGALLPLLTITFSSEPLRVWVTVASVAAALVLTGWVSARLGRSPLTRAVARNVAGGLLAMGVTYLIGLIAGAHLG